jgi:hypothetical protein
MPTQDLESVPFSEAENRVVENVQGCWDLRRHGGWHGIRGLEPSDIYRSLPGQVMTPSGRYTSLSGEAWNYIPPDKTREDFWSAHHDLATRDPHH